MGIFNFFNKKQTAVVPQAPIAKTTNTAEFNAYDFANCYQIPQQELMPTANGYLFGVNGMAPEEFNILYHQSPLHSSILDFKKLLTVGQGYTIDSSNLDTNQKILLNQLTNQFDKYLGDMAQDFYLHSRVYFECTWNKDFTKIIKIERVAPEKIRIFKVDEKMKPTSFLYNWDWVCYTRFTTKEIPAFDCYNKKDRVQLFYFHLESPGMRLYPYPTYKSALPWVILDAGMGEYHEANINNSVNPSMLIQYFQKPETKEKKQEILYDLNQSFAGKRKTGRLMVTFSDGKELAPTVNQMEANKLDKTFLQLTDTIQRQICYAHKIDPQLLGLKTPGSLGDSGSFPYAFKLFNSSVIQPTQLILEGILNEFLEINGLGVKLTLNEPDILSFIDAEVAPGKEKMKSDKPAENSKEEPAQVNEHLKNLTGKQTQGLMRIMTKYAKGQLTKEQASVLLKNSFGLSDEDIQAFLIEE